eukprot:3055261-Pyramimonas_sp.AAC.3
MARTRVQIFVVTLRTAAHVPRPGVPLCLACDFGNGDDRACSFVRRIYRLQIGRIGTPNIHHKIPRYLCAAQWSTASMWNVPTYLNGLASAASLLRTPSCKQFVRT